MVSVLQSRHSITWLPFDGGSTIGNRGSEEGTIVRDEEHALGARITLERGGVTAPFGLTCGIYGCMVHTAWASSEAEAIGKYDAMKSRLSDLLDLPPDSEAEFLRELHRFVADF